MVSKTCKNKISVATNETETASVPTAPDIVFPAAFPKNMLKRNPASGASNKVNSKLVSIARYPFKFFNLSTSIECRFRYIDTNIASPTATSAAATAIEKKTKTCPSAS